MPDIFIATNNHKVENKKTNHNVPNTHSVASDPTHSHMFASFCQHPQSFSFQAQKHNETILLFLRRHFITNLPWIVIALVLSLIPPVFIVLNNRLPILTTVQIPKQFAIILTLFYYLILFSYIFINFITWFYNVFLLTNERVIDIDYSHIVVHNVAETRVGQIEDVHYVQSGFIRSLFDFGDVFLQTAGSEKIFEALAVPKPRKAANIIAGRIGKEAHEA